MYVRMCVYVRGGVGVGVWACLWVCVFVGLDILRDRFFFIQRNMV